MVLAGDTSFLNIRRLIPVRWKPLLITEKIFHRLQRIIILIIKLLIGELIIDLRPKKCRYEQGIIASDF